MYRVVAWATALVWAAWIASVYAEGGGVLTGRAVDEHGKRVLGAKVSVLLPADRRLVAMEPADPVSGRFRIVLPPGTGHSLRCEVEAPGFERTTINVLMETPEVALGTIRLERSPQVGLGALLLSRSGDGAVFRFDTVVNNEMPVPVEVREVEVRGVARKDTHCIDYSPALVFAVDDRIENGGSVARIGTGDGRLLDRVRIVGEVEYLPCSQIRLRFVFPVSFLLEVGTREKIRVEIPATLQHATQAETRELDLAAWEHFRLVLKLGDGREASALLEKKEAANP